MNSKLTVVIPTLNAAADLPGCLAALSGGSALIGEVILVDGGSVDATVAMAVAAGIRVIRDAAGRGGQLRAGIAMAATDYLLLLHADTMLAGGWAEAVRQVLPKLDQQAFYFRFRLASPCRRARLVEAVVAWRCRRFALPYGDQGLLISRALLAACGGMPDLALMEDVALARRLGRRLRPLAVDAVTSARRYEREGWVRRPLRNLVCLTLYFCGMAPARIRRFYG